jgi:hypothetical protein
MFIRKMLLGLFGVFALGAAAPSVAAALVTYSWTTTSQGFGTNLGQPTAATFQVDLSKVQTGSFSAQDITNVSLAYPGLAFNAFTASSGGLDNAAYVNPLTGALVFNNINQGLSVIGYQGGLFSDSFLSITIGNAYSPFGQPLTTVSDQFNALKNGAPFAGFPTAGFWTASLPTVTPTIPEPATWTMMIVGFGVVGMTLRRRRRIAVRFA